MRDLGRAFEGNGHYAEAEKLLRDTLAAQRRVLGPEHPDTLTTMFKLANSIAAQGCDRRAEAEKLWRDTLEARRRVLGAEHLDTLATMDNSRS